MKKIYILLIICSFFKSFSKNEDSLSISKNTLLVGIGVGNKSQFGNFGITSNYFFSKKFNLEFSVGLGMLNFNGVILSLGPEYFINLKKKMSCMIGAVYAYSSSASGDIEVHSIDSPHYNINSGGQYLRGYTGLLFNIRRQIIRFEIGYSYALNIPKYEVSGPWKPAYTKDLETGINSGFLFAISIQFMITKKQGHKI